MKVCGRVKIYNFNIGCKQMETSSYPLLVLEIYYKNKDRTIGVKANEGESSSLVGLLHRNDVVGSILAQGNSRARHNRQSCCFTRTPTRYRYSRRANQTLETMSGGFFRVSIVSPLLITRNLYIFIESRFLEL